MLFGSIFHHFTFLQIAFLPGFVVKNKAVQYRSLRWEKSREIVMKMLRVEKVPLSERICELKLVQIDPRSTHQKRGLCWITK